MPGMTFDYLGCIYQIVVVGETPDQTRQNGWVLRVRQLLKPGDSLRSINALPYTDNGTHVYHFSSQHIELLDETDLAMQILADPSTKEERS